MLKADHWRRELESCRTCKGYDSTEEDVMCPSCKEASANLKVESEKLYFNRELDSLLKQLKQTSDADLTGEYEQILNQVRSGKVMN